MVGEGGGEDRRVSVVGDGGSTGRDGVGGSVP